jgi:hypothetical protein
MESGNWRSLLNRIMREFHISEEEAGKILATIAHEKVASISAVQGGTEKESHHGKSQTRERGTFPFSEKESREC